MKLLPMATLTQDWKYADVHISIPLALRTQNAFSFYKVSVRINYLSVVEINILFTLQSRDHTKPI